MSGMYLISSKVFVHRVNVTRVRGRCDSLGPANCFDFCENILLELIHNEIQNVQGLLASECFPMIFNSYSSRTRRI